MAKQKTSTAAFTVATIAFMRELVQNNNREWFQANRGRYEAVKAELCGVVERVLTGLSPLNR